MQYIDGEFYHIYNRGVHKQPIFFCEENYRYCLRLIEKYKATYRVSIVAYCLMPNHYHLIVRQEAGGSISRLLQTTFNAYTQALNRERNLHGTLFEGRSKSIRIHEDRYMLQLIRYVHLNPVAAGLVALPEQWQHSDYVDWIDRGKSEEIRKFYFKEASAYRGFVEDYRHERENEIFEKYLFD